MKVKFNKFERVAGLFILIAAISSVGFVVLAAIEQGWFESTVKYRFNMPEGNGVYPGTKVNMIGLKIGRVDSVNFTNDNTVIVEISVIEKYAKRIKKESVIHVSRSFIIGEKILAIEPGPVDAEPLAENATIPYEHYVDIVDAFSSQNFGPYLENASDLMKSLSFLANSLLEEKRAKALVETFDEIQPLFKNLNRLSYHMTRKGNMKKLMDNLVYSTNEINKSMKEIVTFSKDLPELGKDTKHVMKHLSELTFHLNSLIPAIAVIAPELPAASKKAIAALDEAVIVLKAMQESFLFNGSIDEIRAQEEKRRKALEAEVEELRESLNKNRYPAEQIESEKEKEDEDGE